MTETCILLVGYGWFAGIPEGETNNSEMIARALDGKTLEAVRPCGETIRARICSLIIPVVWNDAFPLVKEAIARLRPGLVLAMGTDARASSLRPEPYGVNWQRGTDALPDNPALQTNVDGPIAGDGAPWLRGTLPYEAMVTAALQRGVPAQMGALLPAREDVPLPHMATPGLYLCNKMTYLLADYSQRTGLPAGFLHVPTQPAYAARHRLALLEQAAPGEQSAIAERPIAAMPLDMMVEGVQAMLEACLISQYMS